MHVYICMCVLISNNWDKLLTAQFNLHANRIVSTNLRLSPPSAIWWFNWSSNDNTYSFKCALSRHFHTSLSVYLSKGSRFARNVSANNTGSCGMMVIRDRRSCNPNEAMLWSSIMMEPPAASTIRNSPNVSEDLPAPVLPTMPTYKMYIVRRWQY